MANNILNTKSLIEELNQVWQKHVSYLDVASDAYQRLQSSAKLPSNYASALKTQVQNQKDLAKSTEQSNKALEKAQIQRVKDIKHYQNLQKAFDKFERSQEREQRRLEKTQGLYNRIQRGVTAVTRTYNDLAAKKALNGKLTKEEELQLTKLEAKLNKYQGVLKKVDSNIGKYQRNVGNYASGWNGLSNSINQLTREAPAFANSIQTGFMALSNNIPILTDEISNLIKANKALQAEGKPTTSVFKQIMSSLFSFQTMLSLGVTLLVLYGKEIGQWASSVFGASDAASRMAENTKKLNKESAEISSRTIPQFTALVKISQDVTKTEEERAEAIKKLNSEYPDFNTNILQEKDNTELVNNAISEYINKLGQKAKAQASMNMMQEKYNELILKEQETVKFQEEQMLVIAKQQNNEIKTIEQAVAWYEARAYQIEKTNKGLTARNRISNSYQIALDSLNKKREEESQIQEEINALMDIYINNVDLSSDSIKRNTQAKKENVEIDKIQFNFLAGTIPYYEALISSLEEQQKAVSKTSETWNFYQASIDRAKKSLEELRNELGLVEQEQEKSNIFQDGTFIQPNEEVKSNWKETFQTVTDLSRRAFGIMTALSDAYFDRQFSNLEREKEVALQFAGESATAREEIQRQYDERRKKIEQKQAQAKKEQALFDIIVDTASAVVRALPNIPLSIAVGALGAAQLALVASQQIPQFWMGTEGTPSGQIMVNDDPFGKKGANYKEVIQEPSGKLHFPQGKNVKMNVPKGSKVFSNYDNFVKSLDLELMSNNIMPVGQSNIVPMIINQGLNKNDIKEVFGQEIGKLNSTIRNRKGLNVVIDENGIHKYITKQGVTHKNMNARWTGTGLDV